MTEEFDKIAKEFGKFQSESSELAQEEDIERAKILLEELRKYGKHSAILRKEISYRHV